MHRTIHFIVWNIFSFIFAGMDYNLTTNLVTLSPLETNYTVNMIIIDDKIPEPASEEVILTFEKFSDDLDIAFNPTSLTLIIKDDDGM